MSGGNLPDGYHVVPVSAAADVSNRFRKDVVVITTFDNRAGLVHTTTFGLTARDKSWAAAYGEAIAALVGGDVGRKIVHQDFRSAIEAADNAVLAHNAVKAIEVVREFAKTIPDADRQRLVDACRELKSVCICGCHTGTEAMGDGVQ